MGNGSSKPGDAIADRWRDEFAKNRASHRRAHGMASTPDADDTARLQAVLSDSEVPSRAKAAVGFLAAFPERHRIFAWGILALLIGALTALGGAKVAGWLN